MQQSLRPGKGMSIDRAMCTRNRIETYEVIEFYCGDSLVDTGYDLLSNGCGIDVFGIKAITQSGHTSSDFIKLDALLAAI